MAHESTNPNVAGNPNPSSNAGNAPSAGEQAETAAAALGRSAANKAERMRTRAAAGLESAAQSVHAGTERAASVGHSAGDALSHSAHYLESRDVRDMLEDLMDIVRNNPAIALLGAAALGFMVGRVMMRDR